MGTSSISSSRQRATVAPTTMVARYRTAEDFCSASSKPCAKSGIPTASASGFHPSALLTTWPTMIRKPRLATSSRGSTTMTSPISTS